MHHLEQALKAHVLFRKDKDYVVKDGEVIIVDEFTGRLMPGRRWSEGLHQAVEAKEGVYVQKESRTFATITFQNYFRLYKKLAGMTGTGQTSAEEFHKVYKLDVVSIPTNKEMIRSDLPDRIYKTESGKFRAIVAEVKERHLSGQPVLIGTGSIQKNELLSAHFEREGLPHQVLNAKNHEREGEIIAQSGRLGAITVATNMAGRGVDIILGGSPLDPGDALKVRELGGLHVVGTERHDARRTDNQLRGRAGRQGDPGSSQFFISTEDELVRVFGGDRLKNLLDRLGVGEDDVIENNLISRAIEQAQSKIEGNNFDIRKYVLEYDDVMNKHRTATYALRREILESKNLKDKIMDYIHAQIDRILEFHLSPETGAYNIEEIRESIAALIPADIDLKNSLSEAASSSQPDSLRNFIYEFVDLAYVKRESELGEEAMRHLEKMVLLRVIDELWVDHLEQMEYLRDSVRLRAYGQRDPLVEYKIEGQRMFARLQEAVGGQVANLIFRVGVVGAPKRPQKMEYVNSESQNNKSSDVSQSVNNSPDIGRPAYTKVLAGRNDPCPCGAINPATGQVYKYKKCGLINAPQHKKS